MQLHLLVNTIHHYLKLFIIKFLFFLVRIRPICLPINEPLRTYNFVGYRPFIAGWGKTTEGGSSATVLQEVTIPVLKNAVCKARYETVGKLISERQFNDAILCAGVLEGGHDSCQGDSGGPLMNPFTMDGAIHYYQIGVVSYGIGCARVDTPGVYTRITYFIDWIQEHLAEQ